MIIRVQGNRGKKYCVSNSKECFLSPIYIAFRCSFLPSRGWKSIISAQYVARFPSEVLEPTCQECTSSLLPSSTRCLHTYIYTYISAQPVKKPSNQIRAIFLPILSIRSRTFYSCAAGVLHDHHYLLQASRNVQHRIDGWPGMGAALEEHPVQQVQGLSSSKQKRALSQVGTTFGKVSGGKRRWKRQKQAFLRSTVRLLQKLTSVSPYHSVLFYLKIRGFSTKFNQFRFLCFLYIYSLR